MVDDDLRKDGEIEDEDSTVYQHLLRYKGALYACELVERTKDTSIFRVDAVHVRRGLFPKNLLDFRFFKEMDIEYVPLYHAPLLEQ